MNLSKHGFTALSLNAVMASNAASILEFSHTLLTIRKSKSCRRSYNIVTDHENNRVLLASIRNKGKCPCPRCLIPLSDAHRVGTVSDRNKRTTKARVDDVEYRYSIDTARDIIYRRGFAVDSDDVENHLREESLVPTKVS